MRTIETDIRILGGLPVIARGVLCRGDSSTGWAAGVVDITLHTSRGKRAAWAERRMSASDWMAVAESLQEAA